MPFIMFLCSIFFVTSVLADSKLDYQGQLSFFGSTMPNEQLSDVTKNNGGFELNLESKYSFTKTLNFKFQPWIQEDFLTQTSEEKNQIEARELSLEWKKRASSVRIGYSTVNWEGTDFLNPMDIVNAKNYRDPLAIHPLSSPGIFYSDQFHKFSWDLVYITQETASLLPGARSPWWPRRVTLPTEANDTTLLLPSDVQYDSLSNEVFNNAMRNNVAGRLQYHGESFDVSLAASHGASAPYLYPNLDATVVEVYPQQVLQLNSPIHLQPIYYTQNIIAGALSYTLDTWIFRASAQHAQPLGEDPSIPSWSEYGVLAIEKNFDFGDSQHITLILQGTASHRPQNADLSILSTLLQQALMIGWRWSLSEKWTWNAAIFQEEKYKSIYAHSDLNYRVSDHWSALLGADIFNGSVNSILGEYTSNDRYQAKVIYSF